ncbi:peroxiredoxin [Deinococcus maricopensis]|uniref:thioredoxin-dependent peroxiredoxin n=1 Tax=Deinococcus maricopensis (strain DSM 21211 / LMG 22137 / NRRL B-23946 / LB-34) TaxID=709986 RepID=E8U3G2_DEIML|nr:peroxiredoxin [Deinococcus maricopensis]ADV65833.1 alkyl hydroperoxide reductase/ Thiol specific antioxidant/ Mal allergen [Deinococcus maricopensis DSM 21211]
MTIQVGDLAPDVPDTTPPLALSAWRGQWVVLFFFPRAHATHCQMQARRFQALMPEFQALGANIVGVSSDTGAQQMTFRDVCRVSFPLLSDAGERIGGVYGVLEDAVVEDEETRRLKRQTFLIDPQGVVVEHWTEVDPNTHAGEVLAALRQHEAPLA